MKNNLISVFIAWMLYFFTGCYSTSNLTWADLKEENEDAEITFMDAKSQFYIMNKFTDSLETVDYITDHPQDLICTKWILEDDSITLQCAGVNDLTEDSIRGYRLNYYRLSASGISGIKSSKLDETATVFLVVGLILIVIIIISASTFDMKYDFGTTIFFGP